MTTTMIIDHAHDDDDHGQDVGVDLNGDDGPVGQDQTGWCTHNGQDEI